MGADYLQGLTYVGSVWALCGLCVGSVWALCGLTQTATINFGILSY